MIGTDLGRAVELLNQGKLVAIPTETVYGLAANAFNADAVLSIFTAKNRPTFDPLIVHVGSIDAAIEHVAIFDAKAMNLAKAFWPGPLTLVLPKKKHIPDLVSSGLDTVAIRMPRHPMTLALLNQLDFPLAAPSANPFGYVSPTTAGHVQQQLGDKIDYILDGGECEIGIESTIVSFENEKAVVLRLGGITLEEIEEVIGTVHLEINQNSNPKAPGQLDKHYAPLKPLYFGDIDKIIATNSDKRIGILSFMQSYIEKENVVSNFVLSKTGDLLEATHKLFKAIRQLDSLDIDMIAAEAVPTHGLGAAINDRLRRASV
jgi:L-threonylcarbamoyladenylate synthase